MIPTFIKIHTISDTHAYAVEKVAGGYAVVYIKKALQNYTREAIARSNGRNRVYSSPFVADYVIRNEILPLYNLQTPRLIRRIK